MHPPRLFFRSLASPSAPFDDTSPPCGKAVHSKWCSTPRTADIPVGTAAGETESTTQAAADILVDKGPINDLVGRAAAPFHLASEMAQQRQFATSRACLLHSRHPIAAVIAPPLHGWKTRCHAFEPLQDSRRCHCCHSPQTPLHELGRANCFAADVV